jgi:putative ABC transport system substrate-binding protein
MAVLVSLKIRPYLQALEGIQERARDEGLTEVDVTYLDDDDSDDHTRLADKLGSDPFDVYLAVGPEATKFIWDTFPSPGIAKVYCMVLNPDNLIATESEGPPCGVSLNIPVQDQLEAFKRHLPSLKRIGLIYNPDDNADVAREAEMAASLQGIGIVHLKVASRADILPVLQQNWGRIEALWMIPDRTVISESLILYLIKEAISNNVIVLGYNRFFTQSGAALALARNYKTIGRQAAALAKTAIDNRKCPAVIPGYDVLVNEAVLETLGIAFSVQDRPDAEGGQQP